MSARTRLDRRTRKEPAAPKTARRARAAAAPVAAPAPAPARTLRARPRPAAAPDAGPIVKWVGGKSKLLPELTARAPGTFRRYFEPFAGGAALFFRLAPTAAVLNDQNRDLVGTYRAIASDVEGVIRRLEIHRRKHDEEHYYQIRAAWNDAAVAWAPIDRAAAFIYLNKTCFNGLWRVNRSGGFNVPMGRYTDPPICVPDALRAASRVLARADLRCGDFRAAVADAGDGDFVYFDPPYDPLSKTANFTSYTADAFGDDHQRALADLARELVGRGCQVMLSNSDTPFIRSLYRGFRIDQVLCARAINSDAAKRGMVAEVVVRS
jgi:DNA adenine methylase